jgi:hypothetical protein
MELKTWLANLGAIPDLDLLSSDEEHVQLPGKREIGIALIQTLKKKVYALSAPAGTLKDRINVLNLLVDSYKNVAKIDRTIFTDIHKLTPLYTKLSALVIFPKFNIQDLLQLASNNYLLPTGITRTTIAPRALCINIPLKLLLDQKPTLEKNAMLHKLIQERGIRGRIRYNSEAIYLFDE